MITLGQGCRQRDNRILGRSERHLERLCLINLHHEITTVRLRHHTEGCALKGCSNLNPWIGKTGCFRMLKANTSHILNMGICRFHPSARRGYRCLGSYPLPYEATQKQAAKPCLKSKLLCSHCYYLLTIICTDYLAITLRLNSLRASSSVKPLRAA